MRLDTQRFNICRHNWFSVFMEYGRQEYGGFVHIIENTVLSNDLTVFLIEHAKRDGGGAYMLEVW